MTSGLRQRTPFTILALAVVALTMAGVLEGPERFLMDLRFRLLAAPVDSRTVVVGIDPPSLQVLDVWPWPRGYHATVLENLLAAGATRVGFDVDFSSRSDAEEDRELARALEAAGARAVLPRFSQRREGAGEMTRTEPLAIFARTATLASINIIPEQDGLVRRYGPTGPDGGRSFAAAVGEPGLDPAGSFWIDFAIDPASIPRVSFVDVLTGRFDPERLRGKAVIVGATAVELGDQVAVPLTASLPGPVLQAIAHESLARGRALRRTPVYLPLALVVLLGVFVVPRIAALSWRRGLLATAGAVLASFAVAVALQGALPILVDLTPPLAAIVGGWALGLVLRVDQQAVELLFQAMRIRRNQRLMRHVVENSFDAIVTVDSEGRIETFNPAARRMFGRHPSEAIGRPITELIGGLGPGLRPLQRLGVHEALGRRSNGSTFPLEMSVGEIPDDDAPKRVSLLRDVTERKAHEAVLEYQATHDALTHLPNRELLRRRFEDAILDARERRGTGAAGATAAVVLLDLDGFREINDALGHTVGDRLLREIAARLLAASRSESTVARFGGDEFAALLPGADLDGARAHALALARVLVEPFVIDGLSLHIGAGFGIALWPDHGDDASSLMQRADVALYVSKRDKAGIVVYAPEQDYNSVRHLTLKGELRRAIDEGDLVLYYQPQVEARDGRVAGVESLVRWRHPRLGLVPPDEFIALAEHSGLIGPLTHWVLETAIRQAASWRARGLNLRVSANLSARNLREDDLPDRVARLLREYALPPSLLALEITESVIMDDPRRALDVVTRLHELGVAIALDDFGTGYSSLAYLRRLPAREMKIDKSFIRGIADDDGDLSLVRSIIEMAHNLGLEAVAEGVETEAVWRRLVAIGCDRGQGYLFGKPTPAEKVGVKRIEVDYPGPRAAAVP